MLAGDVSLHDVATQTGTSYVHLRAVEHGEHPLTATDCRGLGAVLGVPSEWLVHGWQ